MGARTSIEWTRGDDGQPGATWNPVTGCNAVSPGCNHCYAEALAHRFDGTPQFPNGFQVTLRPERLEQPLRWRRPRRIFVNSMSDLFHDLVPDDYIARVFAVMAAAQHHTFQVLTKRQARMRSLISRGLLALVDYWIEDYGAQVTKWPLPNVWLGVSAENQQWADIRIPALLATPAAIRFVSAEPLLGPIDIWHSRCPVHDCSVGICTSSCPERRRVDWVIVGGESGHGARSMHPDWARALRDQCQQAGTAFLFKQTGSVLAREWRCSGKGTDPAEWPEPFPREYPNAS